MKSNAGTIPGEQYYKDLLLGSPIALYTCDSKGHILFFNEPAAGLWGRHPVIGTDLWCGAVKACYPDGKPMPPEDCPAARMLRRGRPIEKEELIIGRPDGTFRNVLVYPRPIYDSDGKLTGAYSTLVDITDQKKKEEKEAMLSALVTSSDDAIVSKNLNGRITSWNHGAEKIFGYTEQEVLGRAIDIIIPERLLDEEKKIIASIKAGRKIDHFHTTRVTKAGRELQVSLTISPIKDPRGNIIGASKIARDITEQQVKEEQRIQSIQKLETLYEISRLISEKLDVQTILQRVTDATTAVTGAAYGAFFYNILNERGESYMLYTLSGASKADFEGLGMPRNTKIFDPTFKGEAILRVDDITKDPRYGHNPPHCGQPKGHLPVVSYMAVPVVSTSGEVIGGLFFGHPQAGVFRQEHEGLVKSIAAQAAVALDNSKLFEEVKTISAKKDEFIALASHELKTPLTTIKVCLQVMQKARDEKTTMLFLDKSIKQVDKLGALVSDLFDISKIESGKLQLRLEVFDLKQMLLDVIETFQYNRISHYIRFEDHGEAVMIQADRQRIEQAVINLLTNAIKYSPGADEVMVSVSTAGNAARVSVKDKGIGLSEAEQQKIFTRFYRAAGPINVSGLGLGLYLTKEIIDRHYGHIGVNSREGHGAEFYFILPLENAARKPEKNSTPEQ